MATLPARAIYRACRIAGFSPDQATTMTAVALAESGGRTEAHNSRGEDSVGIFQINRRAHDWAYNWDLSDPVTNARAAYRISGRGETIAPWTTTHGGSGARYLTYRQAAEGAARAEGDDGGLGVWSGTSGYGDDIAAGSGGGSTPIMSYSNSDVATVAAGQGSGGSGHDVRTFLDSALAQTGDDYVFGHEVALNDPNPAVFDCSELVQWAAHRAGVEVPDGSWYQYLSLQQRGSAIPVEQAIHTPGALLFSFSSPPHSGGGRPSQAHVAISLGDGRTIEARGSSYGVGSWEATGSRFNYAAVIPSLSAGTAAGSGDSLTAQLDHAVGPDPFLDDRDHDGMTDTYETTVSFTDPSSADSDKDRVPDGVELVLGQDPLVHSTNQGHLTSDADNMLASTSTHDPTEHLDETDQS
jgi:cell wall-associated NlpC family hydrolase